MATAFIEHPAREAKETRATSWDAMLDFEARANLPALAADDWWAANASMVGGRYVKRAFRDAVTWVIRRQLDWESLTERVAIDELRKGQESIFYPLFREDPTIVADCPKDGRTVVGVEGFCPHCGFPFDGSPRIREVAS